jgi:hypothetical protein
MKRRPVYDEEGELQDPEPLPEDEDFDWEQYHEIDPSIMPHSTILLE